RRGGSAARGRCRRARGTPPGTAVGTARSDERYEVGAGVEPAPTARRGRLPCEGLARRELVQRPVGAAGDDAVDDVVDVVEAGAREGDAQEPQPWTPGRGRVGVQPEGRGAEVGDEDVLGDVAGG